MTGKGIAQLRRDRRFAEHRAGTVSAGFARERLDSFLLSQWRMLVIYAVATAAGGVVFWFLTAPLDAFRGFAFGVYLTTMVAMMAHWCVMASGAVNGTMGQAAEEWTNTELRRLRKAGWKVVSHLEFRQWDIDHVAVGPDGVIVVETKWKSGPVDLHSPDGYLREAVTRTARSRKDVAGHLGWGAHLDAPLTSVVVVWGPEVTQDGDEPIEAADGVLVVAGKHLRTVLEDLGEHRLDGSEIDTIYEKLVKQIETRDASKGGSSDSPRPSIHEAASTVLLASAIGVSGSFFALQATRLGVWLYLLTTASMVGIGFAFRRYSALRVHATGWLVGVLSTTAFVLVIVAWNAAVGG